MTKPITKETLVDKVLEEHGKTRKDVVETTGLPMSSLLSAARRDFDKMTIKILRAIATTVGQPLADIVRELDQLEKRK